MTTSTLEVGDLLPVLCAHGIATSDASLIRGRKLGQ
jgi:hypothetical protein